MCWQKTKQLFLTNHEQPLEITVLVSLEYYIQLLQTTLEIAVRRQHSKCCYVLSCIQNFICLGRKVTNRRRKSSSTRSLTFPNLQVQRDFQALQLANQYITNFKSTLLKPNLKLQNFVGDFSTKHECRKRKHCSLNIQNISADLEVFNLFSKNNYRDAQMTWATMPDLFQLSQMTFRRRGNDAGSSKSVKILSLHKLTQEFPSKRLTIFTSPLFFGNSTNYVPTSNEAISLRS